MFNLNKSLAQLKAFVEENNLQNDSHKNVSKKKLKKKIDSENTELMGDKRGVIMIKNFPHGFYEKQMFDYFSQFGEVTRLKIMRSRKTGHPRNYGFIEFRFDDVAKIAAETMDNYLMFDKIVKCTLLPDDKVPRNIFKNWNRPFISSVKKNKDVHNRTKTTGQELSTAQKYLKRLKNQEKILKENGIEFECVVINRPSSDLSAIKNQIRNNQPIKTEKIPEEIIRMKYPKMTLSQIMRKKRYIIPKFMKIKAGFRPTI